MTENGPLEFHTVLFSKCDDKLENYKRKTLGQLVCNKNHADKVNFSLPFTIFVWKTCGPTFWVSLLTKICPKIAKFDL